MCEKFLTPQPGDPPPYDGFPARILYTDTLIPIEQWSNTETSYYYRGPKGAPELSVKIVLNEKTYFPKRSNKSSLHRLNTTRGGSVDPIWLQNVKTDLALYTRVYCQLTQNYDNAGVPGLSGNAVSAQLVNTLLSETTSSQPEGLLALLVDYIEQCIRYLQGIIADDIPATVPTVDLIAAIQLNDISKIDIIPLSVTLVFKRQGLLCDPVLQGPGEPGMGVESNIPAATEAPSFSAKCDAEHKNTDMTPSLVPFATTMENVFATDTWLLRVGISAADPAGTAQSPTPSLWAVRFSLTGATTPDGLDFTIGSNPIHYAPKPLATAFRTFNADIETYKTGQKFPAGDSKITVTFSGTDPNLWYAEFLTAVDVFLTAPYATPVFVLDKLLNPDDSPEATGNKGFLAKMLGYKAHLAESMPRTLSSIYEYESDDSRLKAAATEKFRQALHNRLSVANTLTSVSVFPVSGARYNPPLKSGEIRPPRFYGQPVKNNSAQEEGNYSFSTAKVDLTDSAGDGNSALAFLFDSRYTNRRAYMTINLIYSLTHLEFNIRNVPGIKNYEQSSFISFLTGPYRYSSGDSGSSVTFPNILRALPTPPTMVAQSGVAVNHDKKEYSAVEVNSLRRWSYEFSYSSSQAAQDRVLATVEFNRPANIEATFNTAGESAAIALYKALARFRAIYPAVSQDLEIYLRPLNSDSDPASPDTLNARYAVEALDNVISEVVSKFEAWANPSINEAYLNEAAPRVIYQFEVGMHDAVDKNHRAIVEVAPHLFTLDKKPVSNFLPPAVVEIDPANYVPELVGSNESGYASYQYRYKDQKEGESTYLRYDKALNIAERTVRVPGIDLIALQSGWAAVQVTRNQRLAPEGGPKTSPDFTFISDEGGFADVMQPFLVYPSVSLGTGTKPQLLEAWLSEFFTSLLTPNLQTPFTQATIIKLEAQYSYLLSESVADLSHAVLPLLSLSPTSTKGEITPSFIAAVAKEIQRWFDTVIPITRKSAAFSFQISVFPDSGNSNMPIMVIQKLTLPAELVSHRLLT